MPAHSLALCSAMKEVRIFHFFIKKCLYQIFLSKSLSIKLTWITFLFNQQPPFLQQVPFFEHVLCNRLSYHCQNSKIIKISSMLKKTLSIYYARCWGGTAYTKGGWRFWPRGFIFQLRMSIKQRSQQCYDVSRYKVVGVRPGAKELVTSWALCIFEGINKRRDLQWMLGR